jgi:hypothetical protein
LEQLDQAPDKDKIQAPEQALQEAVFAREFAN